MITNSDKNCDNCLLADQTNRRYRYLLSSFSHEVRNPLTLIYSSLQLIEHRHPEVCDTPLWMQIKDDVKDTIQLLRDLTSPENEDQRPKQPIRLSAMLEKQAVSCRAFMEEQDVQLISEIAPDLPIISGNETKLKEAVLNLLLNACDAAAEHAASQNKINSGSAITKSHRKTGQVSLRAFQENQKIYIHVRDNGSGIPTADRASILEPFVTHKAAGTGLGLTIIQNIAQQHGGSLSFETSTQEPESYTDFCLQLPI